MIAPLPEWRLAPDQEARTPAPADAPVGGIRFADLMVEQLDIAAALTDARSPAPPGAGAQLFNQDGFFGDAVAGLADHAVATSVPPGTEVPVQMPQAPKPSSHAPQPAQAFATTMRATRAGEAVHDAPASPVNRQTAPAVMREPVAAPPAAGRRTESDAPVRAPRATPPPRRAPEPDASVGIAVRAVAQGLDVAARVAGLDAAERARLADEIAALLSSHGYPPGRITVVAAPAATQEQR